MGSNFDQDFEDAQQRISKQREDMNAPTPPAKTTLQRLGLITLQLSKPEDGKPGRQLIVLNGLLISITDKPEGGSFIIYGESTEDFFKVDSELPAAEVLV